MLVMNLLQSLLGRAVQLEFYHIDKLVSLQDKVNASFARMIFHLGIYKFYATIAHRDFVDGTVQSWVGGQL